MHVRLTESLTRRTGHHLNLAVQDYFSSGIPGIFFYRLQLSSVLPLVLPLVLPVVLSSSDASTNPPTKAGLRREARRQRRALTPAQQRYAAQRLYRLVVTHPLFRFSSRIAFTIAADGEISPQLLLMEAWRRGKACYLPVMDPLGHNRLRFRRWLPGQPLVKGAYGIPVPQTGQVCPPRLLSLVLLPLVAFDAGCRRLGMGKGFYDRTFAFLRQSTRRSPKLLGLAHECQRVERLEADPWDLPLDGVASDRGWYSPGQGHGAK